MTSQPGLSQRLSGAVAGGLARALDAMSDVGVRGRFLAPILCATFGVAAWWADASWFEAGRPAPRLSVFWALVALSYLAGGLRATVAAIAEARKWRPDVNGLMIIAALGSLVIGHWDEGAVLLFLFSLSDALEFYAFQRTQHSVTDLVKLRPETASVVRDGREFTVAVEQLRIDDAVRVRPGALRCLDFLAGMMRRVKSCCGK